MMGFMDRLRKAKEYLDDAEQVYAALKQRGDPEPLHVLLPLAYKRFVVESQSNIDQGFAAFAGSYLSSRYPELTRYFITPEQRKAMDSYFKTLDDYFSGNRAVDGAGAAQGSLGDAVSGPADVFAGGIVPPAGEVSQESYRCANAYVNGRKPVPSRDNIVLMKHKEVSHG